MEEEIGQPASLDEGTEEEPVASQTPTTEEESPGEEDSFSRSSEWLLWSFGCHGHCACIVYRCQFDGGDTQTRTEVYA